MTANQFDEISGVPGDVLQLGVIVILRRVVTQVSVQLEFCALPDQSQPTHHAVLHAIVVLPILRTSLATATQPTIHT